MGLLDSMAGMAKSAAKAGANAAKSGAKRAVKRKIENTKLVKKLREMEDKFKKLVKNGKRAYKAAVWIVKILIFLATNPIGWVIDVILLLILLVWGMSSGGGAKTDNANNLATNGKGNSSFVKKAADDKVKDDGKLVVLYGDCKPTNKKSNKSSSGTVSSEGAGDSDTFKEGTTAYKNAKAAFEKWTSNGASGEAAAAMIGWTQSEGGWYIIGRAEGHYSNVIEEDSIMYGVVPIPSQSHYSVGGGGIFQFTPYTKYGELSESKWEDAPQMNEFVMDIISKGDWNPKYDLTGGNHSFKDFASSDNAEEAVLMFNAYERGNEALHSTPEMHAKKKADAKRASEAFNKDKVPFDEEKFNKRFGSSSSSGGSSSSSSSSSKKDKKKCAPSKESSGGSGWSAHKSGKADPARGAWKYGELPDSLKPYALDPESVGLHFSNSEGWACLAWIGNQCTDLSASLAYALWEKDGHHPTMKMGNGIEVAKNWAATFGGSTTNEPHAGSIFSHPVPGNAYGHTGIVSHVFEDGSILTVEQNWTGYSGEGNGQIFTWHYVVHTADELSSWEFYNPEDAGYKLVPEAKALA